MTSSGQAFKIEDFLIDFEHEWSKRQQTVREMQERFLAGVGHGRYR